MKREDVVQLREIGNKHLANLFAELAQKFTWTSEKFNFNVYDSLNDILIIVGIDDIKSKLTDLDVCNSANANQEVKNEV